MSTVDGRDDRQARAARARTSSRSPRGPGGTARENRKRTTDSAIQLDERDAGPLEDAAPRRPCGGVALPPAASPGAARAAAELLERRARRGSASAEACGRRDMGDARRAPAAAGRQPSPGYGAAAWPERASSGWTSGGRSCSSGAVDSDLAVHHRAQRRSQGLDTTELLDTLAEIVREAAEAAPGPVLGAGFGIPGVLDRRRGIVAACPHLPLEGVPVPGADGGAARHARRGRQRRQLRDARGVAPRRGGRAGRRRDADGRHRHRRRDRLRRPARPRATGGAAELGHMVVAARRPARARASARAAATSSGTPPATRSAGPAGD